MRGFPGPPRARKSASTTGRGSPEGSDGRSTLLRDSCACRAGTCLAMAFRRRHPWEQSNCPRNCSCVEEGADICMEEHSQLQSTASGSPIAARLRSANATARNITAPTTKIADSLPVVNRKAQTVPYKTILVLVEPSFKSIISEGGEPAR